MPEENAGVEVKVGMKVRHKTSYQIGVVVSVSRGFLWFPPVAEVSTEMGWSVEVPLVCLEAVD